MDDQRQSPRYGVQTHVLLALLDEISRHRALSSHETDIIEAIIKRQRSKTLRRNWTAEDDAALLDASKRRDGVGRYCRLHGISISAGWSRLNRLRKAARAAKHNCNPDQPRT